MTTTAATVRCRRRSRGFSLVELLVVIGILALLVAIVTVGLSSVLGGQESKETQVRLEALNSMVAAYSASDSASSGQQLPPRITPDGSSSYGGAGFQWYSTVDGAWGDKNASPTAAVAAANGAPLRVDDDDYDGNDDDELDSSTVVSVAEKVAGGRTQAVIRQLLRVEQNNRAFFDLPGSFRSSTIPITPDGRLFLVNERADPPLPLDGHGGVILYVPPTGLAGVRFRDGDNGQFDANDLLVPVNNRGFFMSAGVDGDYTTGDDNVYSVEVRPVRVP
ncbi:MAG: prepilin-type N-terminal cleavage/methylation domain-containing protein [Planctomycetota bacterium]